MGVMRVIVNTQTLILSILGSMILAKYYMYHCCERLSYDVKQYS